MCGGTKTSMHSIVGRGIARSVPGKTFEVNGYSWICVLAFNGS